MTADTVAGDVVVTEIGGRERNRRMTIRAVLAAVDMTGVFARRRRAIVATDAAAEHLEVIDLRDRSKRNDRMAVLADSGCCYMAERLTHRLDAVVTTGTVASDVVMIEIGRRKSDRRMTVLASIAAWNMVCALAERNAVVMTTDAAAKHLRVIHRHHGCEVHDRMTVFADVCRRRMINRSADDRRVVVAADAVTDDVVVIEVGRRPAQRRMAVVAGVAAGDMIGRLAIHDLVIVAADARAQYLRMVDAGDGHEARGGMAVLAKARGRNVQGILAGGTDAVMAAGAA